MMRVERRFLQGEAVGREEMRARPVESERIAAIIEHVKRRAQR